LNHHYRIIWSQISHTWVAVSEISKGHGKSASARKRVVGALALLGISAVSMSSSAAGLPTGAQVTAGSATVKMPQNGSLQVVQSSQRAVINWNNFSIAQGNQVTFSQPNSSAATLNIVTGNSASTIAGTLTGTGSVYLINQNGIAITPTGLVDTHAGFIASTLQMDENAFMDGGYRFSGKGGSVVNQGQILTGSGGTVVLLGSTVVNEGLISVPLGKVALGSGEAATLDLSGDGFLQVMLPTSAVVADGQALVTNRGVIQADGGMVMLKAATIQQAVREAVYMPGDISARSVSGKNGAIVLDGGTGGNVRVTGTLSADGDTTGGRIDVTGANVALVGASLSATGTELGGLVRVGGAFQGGRTQPADSANAMLFAGRFGNTPAISSSSTTNIDAASSINVSATGETGKGGTAIVWSDSTTVMQGAISARGAAAGGAVEVSAKSTVQAVALNRIDLGAGGNLLIDPQDIVIDSTGTDPAGNYGYAAPSTVTHLLDADIVALLSTGVTVNLQASEDISWLNNFTFVTRTLTTPGGNLNLSAGRSVTLSGIFNTADGNWSIVANDTAANGVVDAERGAGAAKIDVMNANFINSNGNLSLTLADGAGNTNNQVDGIVLGKFNGNGLTATIVPTATPAFGTARILLTDDINVSGSINLTGNLLVSGMGPVVSLIGQSVTWTNEKTDGTIIGEGTIKFVENGLTTHLGQLSGVDATRLELNDQSGLTRVYGDSDPVLADLTAPLLRVAAYSSNSSVLDPLNSILGAGSVALSGPGALASAGNSNAMLSATSSTAFASGLSGSYFVDLSTKSIPLTITQRLVTHIVLNGSYTYGSPDAVASLSGLVNGDVLAPLATLNGTANVTMYPNGLGFGFDPTLHAGASTFSLTGLSGAKAGNYILDLSVGSVSGTLNIAPKALNYIAANGGNVYGSAGTMPTATLSGVVAGDDAAPVVALTSAGQTVSLAARTPASTYSVDVVGLTGAAESNYTIAATGNSSGTYTVAQKPILAVYSPVGVTSVYGTADYAPVLAQGVTLTGVLAGDAVVPNLQNGGFYYGTSVGVYAWGINGLLGARSGNYTLANSSDQGKLTITQKPIFYSGGNTSQIYGQATLPSPFLIGVLASDLSAVSAPQIVTYPPAYSTTGSGNIPVGTYQVDLGGITGSASGNYLLDRSASTPLRVAVTPKPVSIAFMDTLDSIYGTQADTSTVRTVLSGTISGDIVAGQAYAYDQTRGGGNVVSNTPVGTYNLALNALSGADSANYMVADTRQSISSLYIHPKNVTVQFTNPGSTYVYGDIVNFGGVVDGLVAGDIVTPVLTTLNSVGLPVTNTYLNVGNYSTVAESLAGPNAWNYRLTNSQADFKITPRQLVYTIPTMTIQYGGFADNSGSIFFSNLVGRDSVGAILGYAQVNSSNLTGYFSGGTVMTARSPVGYYMMSVTGLNGDASNYMLPPPGSGSISALLTITPKPITSNIGMVNSVYLTPVALGPGSLDGVLAGDIVNPGPTALADGSAPNSLTNAGSYNLHTTSIWGAQAANYTLIASIGVLTIAPKVIDSTLSLTWNGQQIQQTDLGAAVVYGTYYRPTGAMSSSDMATYGINASVALAGVLLGQDVKQSVQSVPDIPFSKSGSYQVGTYEWQRSSQLTGADAGNYVLSSAGTAASTMRIVPKTISGAVSVVNGTQVVTSAVYGSTAGLSTIADGRFDVVSTPFGKDDVAVQAYFSPSSEFVTLTDRQSAGTYATQVAVRGSDAANYVLNGYTLLGNHFEVTPKVISVGIAGTSLSVNYGTTRLPWVYTGVLPGDTVAALSYLCGGVCNLPGVSSALLPYHANAGNYEVTVTGLEGVSAANYQLTPAWLDPTNHQFGLSIVPLPLRWNTNAVSQSLVFGDGLAAIPDGWLSGFLTGDSIVTLASVPTATPISVAVGGAGVRSGVGTLLDAGTYAYGGVAVAGGNYTLPDAPAALLTVAPRVVKVSALPDISTSYGSYVTPQPTFDNTVAGHPVSGIVSPVNASGVVLAPYNETSSAGEFTTQVTALSGADAANYTVDPASVTGKLSISKRQLVLESSSATATTVYGTSAEIGKVTGVLFNDDVSLNTTNGGVLPVKNDTVVNPVNLNVGSYSFEVPANGLAGAKADNYLLPKGSALANLTVTPKSITYAVGDATGQYGNYQACDTSICNPWVPGIALGQIFLQGTLAGDTVGGTIGLLDIQGLSGNLDAHTPVGNYFEVLKGLTGASAANYVIAVSGSKPGLLTITPMWLSYSVSSAVFLISGGTGPSGIALPGSGLVGTPGIATLRGPNGTPINGDDVQGQVVMRYQDGFPVTDVAAEFANLSTQTYSFGVEGLVGKNAGNYRILPNTHTTLNSTYGNNDKGTLQVFDSPSLGLAYTLPNSTYTGGDKSNAVIQPLPYQSDLDKANASGTQSSTSATVGVTGAKAGASFGVISNLSADLGSADLSVASSAVTSALAKAGITGVEVVATANAGVDVKLTFGPGAVDLGLTASALTSATLDRNGVALVADARAGAAGSISATQNLGSGVTGQAGATANAYAEAKAANQYTYKDGKIQGKADEFAGVGSSAGVNGGVSGSAGSASASATVYSPGSVGVTAGGSAGMDGNKLNLGVTIGGSILFGGMSLNLDFSIDLSPIISTLPAVASVFGVSASSSEPPPPPTPEQLQTASLAYIKTLTPLQRYAYLSSNKDWDNNLNPVDGNQTAEIKAYQKFYTDFYDFDRLLSQTMQNEQNLQKDFLAALETDPAKAIAIDHNAISGVEVVDQLLNNMESDMGIRAGVSDGKLSFEFFNPDLYK